MTMITRRNFLKYGAGASAALSLPWTARQLFAARPARSMLTKYIQPLPLPGAGIVVATPTVANHYHFTQIEIARQLHPHLPPTPLFAYDDGSGLGGQAGSFGMAVVAQSGMRPCGRLHFPPLPSFRCSRVSSSPATPLIA